MTNPSQRSFVQRQRVLSLALVATLLLTLPGCWPRVVWAVGGAVLGAAATEHGRKVKAEKRQSEIDHSHVPPATYSGRPH